MSSLGHTKDVCVITFCCCWFFWRGGGSSHFNNVPIPVLVCYLVWGEHVFYSLLFSLNYQQPMKPRPLFYLHIWWVLRNLPFLCVRFFFSGHPTDTCLVTPHNQHACFLPDIITWILRPFNSTTLGIALNALQSRIRINSTFPHFLVRDHLYDFTVLLAKSTDLLPCGETGYLKNGDSGLLVIYILFWWHILYFECHLPWSHTSKVCATN